MGGSLCLSIGVPCVYFWGSLVLPCGAPLGQVEFTWGSSTYLHFTVFALFTVFAVLFTVFTVFGISVFPSGILCVFLC